VDSAGFEIVGTVTIVDDSEALTTLQAQAGGADASMAGLSASTDQVNASQMALFGTADSAAGGIATEAGAADTAAAALASAGAAGDVAAAGAETAAAGAETAAAGIDSAAGAADMARGAFMSMAKSMGLIIGAVEVVKFFKDAVTGGYDLTQQETLLAEANKRATGATNEQSAAVDKQIMAWARATGYAHSDMFTGYEKLIGITKSETKALADVKLATDLAAAKHMDYAAAVGIVSKVETGHVSLLARMGMKVTEKMNAVQLDNVATSLATKYGFSHATALKAVEEAASGNNSMLRQLGVTSNVTTTTTMGTTQALNMLHKAYDGTAQKMSDKDPWNRVREGLSQFVDDAGQKAVPVLNELAQGILKEAPAVESGLKKMVGYVGPLVGAIVNLIRDHWTTITAETSRAWGVVKTVVAATIAVVKDIINVAMDIIDNKWTGTWGHVRDIVVEVLSVVYTFVSTMVHEIEDTILIFADILQGHWGAAWKACVDLLKQPVRAIEAIVKDMLSIVLDVLKIGGDAIAALWRVAWNALVGVVKSVGSQIESAAKAIISAIVGFFKKLPTDLYNIGKDAASGLLHGLEHGAGAVYDGVKSVAGHVEGAFKSVLHIFSPSEVFRQHGLNTMLGYQQGVLQQSPSVYTQMQQSATGVVTTMKTYASQPMFQTWGQNIMQSLATGIKSMQGTVTGAVTSVMSAAASAGAAAASSVGFGASGGVGGNGGSVSGREAMIIADARRMGVDPAAALSIAAVEGLSGGIGDNGSSFGPFQLHVGGAFPSGIGGTAADKEAWANSAKGIAYAMEHIASVARGLTGQAAINAISSRFERPDNVPGEEAAAWSHYGSMRNVVNNYILNVHSNATRENLVADFHTLHAMRVRPT
jgi:hypothetical protein